MSEGRLIPLEAFRGIAAYIVLVHHFFLGFSPLTTGAHPAARNGESIIGQPYFFLVNGVSAVAFFFSLSGFVLCWSFFIKQDLRKLQFDFLKRYPRLVGIVALTTLLSYLIFKFDGYYFVEAARQSGSPWLVDFAGAGWRVDFQPSLAGAVWEGLTTFFSGRSSYNANLWTMQPEYSGSLIVFILAPFIVFVLRHRNMLLSFLLVALTIIPWLVNLFPFVAGVFAAAYVSRARPSLPFGGSILLVGFGLYLLGYAIPDKAYAWVSLVPGRFGHQAQIIINTVGALAVIYATMANKRVFKSLSGRFFAFLGKLSFPLYLIHTLVICSLSSWLYVELFAQGFQATTVLLLVFGFSVFASTMLSIPLISFDKLWVALIGRVIGARVIGAFEHPINAADKQAAVGR